MIVSGRAPKTPLDEFDGSSATEPLGWSLSAATARNRVPEIMSINGQQNPIVQIRSGERHFGESPIIGAAPGLCGRANLRFRMNPDRQHLAGRARREVAVIVAGLRALFACL